jgi:PAS domain S-box-containing protein
MKPMNNGAQTHDGSEPIDHGRAWHPFGYWEWDCNTGDVTWSDGLFRVLGLEPGSVAPSYDLFLGMVHPEDRAGSAAAGQALADRSQYIDSEFRIVQPQGTVRWVASKGEVFRDQAGKASWAAGMLIDITNIREAQSELSAREERYRALALASSIGEWRATSQGNAIEAQSWANFTGRAFNDCTGRGWLAAIHPKDVDAVGATWDEAVRIGSYFEMSFRLQHRSGQYRWVLCKAVPIKPRDGPVREWVGTAEDIHAKREMEELLRVHEERLRQAHFEGPMVTWDFNLETGQITRSDNAEDVLGVGSETVEEFQSSIHPDDRAKIEALVRATRHSGKAFSAEYRRTSKDGRVVWLRSRVRVMPAAYGGADHVIGITFNMTSQKEAEFADQETRRGLRELDARNQALMKAAGDFVWTVSPDGRVSDSPEWRAFTGQGLDQIQGWGWLNAVHPADRERIRETVQRIMDTRRVSSYEYRVRDRSGEYHWFRSSIAPVLNEEGTPVEWMGAAQRVAGSGREPEGTFTSPPQGVLPPHSNGQLRSWQVRAARGILGWSVRELADKSGVSVSTIRRVEDGQSHDGRILLAIRGTLEQAGIGFVPVPGGELAIMPIKSKDCPPG